METDLRQPDLGVVLGEILEASPETLRFRRSSTGRFNTTWFVDGGGKSVVVRVAPEDDRRRMLFYEHRMMRQEPEVHRCVLETTSIPAPRVIAFREADPLLGRDFIVFERLPGHPLAGASGGGAEDTLLRELGAALRQLHGVTRPRYGYLGAHRPMKPCSSWREAFLAMWEGLLDDIGRCRGYTPEELAGMRRLPDLYDGIFDFPEPASLLHMDVWSENILTDGSGRLTGLIDWDRALWGDPEIEFAVLDYCGLSGPAFWEGYGRPREDTRESRIRKVFYLLYEIQKYIVISRVRRNDSSRADLYRRNALELARVLMR